MDFLVDSLTADIMDIFACAHRTFSTQNQIDNRQLASKTQKFSYRALDVVAISWKSHLCKISSLLQAAVVTTTRGLTAKTCLHFDSWCPSRYHRRMTSYRPHHWSIDQNVSYLPTTSLLWLNSSLWTRLAAVIRDYECQATPSPDRSKDQNNISRHENTRNIGAYCRSKRYKYLPTADHRCLSNVIPNDMRFCSL